jgi:hypothetical protein
LFTCEIGVSPAQLYCQKTLALGARHGMIRPWRRKPSPVTVPRAVLGAGPEDCPTGEG